MEANHEVVTVDKTDAQPLAEHKQSAPVVVQDNGVSPLVQMFATGDYKIEQIREFMALQREFDEDQGKKAYNVAMAKARSEMGAAKKSNKNDFTGSSYSDISDLIRAAGPALADNGFNWSWKFDHSEKGFLTCYCHMTHAQGHTETYPYRGPDAITVTSKQGRQVNNPAQSAGSARSYARRYSFIDAVGLASEDDDGHAAGAAYRNEPEPPKIINDKQAGEIEDLLTKLEDHQEGFRSRWFNHYKASWAEQGNPPGLAIPVMEHAATLAELKNKLKKFDDAAQEQGQ